jgi:hypothetical protein
MSDSSPQPVNAFSREYIEALRQRDEPASVTDGDVLGPWRLEERSGEFHVFREWEAFQTGHSPVASFKSREDALFFQVALGIAGRPAILRAHEAEEPGKRGYVVEREGETVGSLRMYRAEVLVIAHTLASLARSPVDLSILFELSGSQVQEMTGEILGQGVLDDPDPTWGV